MSSHGWIGVDLDGTLAYYEGWKSELEIGSPIEPMVERVKRWLARGHRVKIFTARVWNGGDMPRDIAPIVAAIQDWTEQHIGQRLEVTCVKDYEMLELWDDRAVQVEPNTGQLIGRSTRHLV